MQMRCAIWGMEQAQVSVGKRCVGGSRVGDKSRSYLPPNGLYTHLTYLTQAAL